MNVNKGCKHLSNGSVNVCVCLCVCVCSRLVDRLIDEQMGQNVNNTLTIGESG